VARTTPIKKDDPIIGHPRKIKESGGKDIAFSLQNVSFKTEILDGREKSITLFFSNSLRSLKAFS
jgi:hypothetical protein